MNIPALWNVFDSEMTLRGVCAARDEGDAVRQVADWHSTGRVEGWSARPAALVPAPAVDGTAYEAKYLQKALATRRA